MLISYEVTALSAYHGTPHLLPPTAHKHALPSQRRMNNNVMIEPTRISHLVMAAENKEIVNHES